MVGVRRTGALHMVTRLSKMTISDAGKMVVSSVCIQLCSGKNTEYRPRRQISLRLIMQRSCLYREFTPALCLSRLASFSKVRQTKVELDENQE